jgi:3',5'-cyclic-AMP phosphodiesterase
MRFALISDVHFGPPAYHKGKLRKLTHRAEALTAAFVERMNAVDHPELVINLGDVVEDEGRDQDLGQYRRFIHVLGGLNARVLHVAGNHDQVCLSDDDLRALWRHMGPLYYSCDLGDVHWVALRTVDEPGRAIHLPTEQLVWLAEDLATAPCPTIVLLHHPASEMRLDGNRWFEGRAHRCLVAERQQFRAIVEGSGKVVAVFNGHAHWNHLDVIAGIPYVTLQSLTENLDDDAPGRPANAWAVCDLDEQHPVIHVHGEEPQRYQFELP